MCLPTTQRKIRWLQTDFWNAFRASIWSETGKSEKCIWLGSHNPGPFVFVTAVGHYPGKARTRKITRKMWNNCHPRKFAKQQTFDKIWPFYQRKANARVVFWRAKRFLGKSGIAVLVAHRPRNVGGQWWMDLYLTAAANAWLRPSQTFGTRCSTYASMVLEVGEDVMYTVLGCCAVFPLSCVCALRNFSRHVQHDRSGSAGGPQVWRLRAGSNICSVEKHKFCFTFI